jgi:hypothetical protein
MSDKGILLVLSVCVKLDNHQDICYNVINFIILDYGK